jgi:hypothetical protein
MRSTRNTIAVVLLFSVRLSLVLPSLREPARGPAAVVVTSDIQLYRIHVISERPVPQRQSPSPPLRSNWWTPGAPQTDLSRHLLRTLQRAIQRTERK